MEKKSSGSLLFHSSAIQIGTKMTCFSLCIFCSEYKNPAVLPIQNRRIFLIL